MKKHISIYVCWLMMFLFTGCANNTFKYENTIEKKENEIFLSKNWKLPEGKHNFSLEEEALISFKSNMYDISKFAIKNNKNFIIVNPEINNSLGFPINTYSDLKEYCFKEKRTPNVIKISCSSVKQLRFRITEINFILVDKNLDYSIFSYDSEEVKKEIENER